FVLLAVYAPSTPAMLIAVYPAVLIEMVIFDGAIGSIYGIVMFVIGLASIQLLQGRLSWTELVLWSAIMTVIAASLTLSSQVLLGAAAPDVIPQSAGAPAQFTPAWPWAGRRGRSSLGSPRPLVRQRARSAHVGHRFWNPPLWRGAAAVCLAVGMGALRTSAPSRVAAATTRYGA